ncbi:MAG: dTMP kinase [Nanoarchaeota archaeon]
MKHNGLFITFEGGEGGGKSTQIKKLSQYLTALNHTPVTLREPGATPIGEEIRHTLKYSKSNIAMTPEAELLLMNASRAQLVREVIRPALSEGKIVLCDRFYDSTIAYQGYGRKLFLPAVQSVIDFAVGDTRPDLTLLLDIPLDISEERRKARLAGQPEKRDRIEDEADRSFFKRVQTGFYEIAKAEPNRVKLINASGSMEEVYRLILTQVNPILRYKGYLQT